MFIFQAEKIEIKKSGSAMTCAISQLVYMPNLRAIRQTVWEKNANRQTHRNTETHTDTLIVQLGGKPLEIRAKRQSTLETKFTKQLVSQDWDLVQRRG